MLNQRKIRLMSRLAIYEGKEGKEDIKLSKFFKTDFVRYKTIKSIVAVTFGYLTVLVMIMLYYGDFLVKEAVRLDYVLLGRIILAGYAGVVVLYVIVSLIGYNLYYTNSRKKLSKYFKLLRRLRNIYKEEGDR